MTLWKWFTILSKSNIRLFILHYNNLNFCHWYTFTINLLMLWQTYLYLVCISSRALTWLSSSLTIVTLLKSLRNFNQLKLHISLVHFNSHFLVFNSEINWKCSGIYSSNVLIFFPSETLPAPNIQRFGGKVWGIF